MCRQDLLTGADLARRQRGGVDTQGGGGEWGWGGGVELKLNRKKMDSKGGLRPP